MKIRCHTLGSWPQARISTLMNQIHFIRSLISLPIVVPLLSIPFAVYDLDRYQVANFLIFSLVIAGIPYAIFAIIALWILWKKPVKHYWRFYWMAPPMFIPVLAAYFAVYWIEIRWLPPFDLIARIFAIYSLFVIVLGYIYVGLAWIGLKILLRLKLLKTMPNQASQDTPEDVPPL